MVTFLLASIVAWGGTFPSAVGELYCSRRGYTVETCRLVRLEEAVCFSKLTASECRDIEGPELCRKGGETSEKCANKTYAEGLCQLMGQSVNDCRGVTPGTLACLQSGPRSMDDCRGLTESEAVCLSMGFTMRECKGLKPAQILCLAKKADLTACREIP